MLHRHLEGWSSMKRQSLEIQKSLIILRIVSVEQIGMWEAKTVGSEFNK